VRSYGVSSHCCKGNDYKKYDDKVWWEDVKTIVQENNKVVDNLPKCDLKNGDQVLVKFSSSKAKKPKLYNGVVEFPPVLQAMPDKMESEEVPTPKKKRKQEIQNQSRLQVNLFKINLLTQMVCIRRNSCSWVK